MGARADTCVLMDTRCGGTTRQVNACIVVCKQCFARRAAKRRPSYFGCRRKQPHFWPGFGTLREKISIPFTPGTGRYSIVCHRAPASEENTNKRTKAHSSHINHASEVMAAKRNKTCVPRPVQLSFEPATGPRALREVERWRVKCQSASFFF